MNLWIGWIIELLWQKILFWCAVFNSLRGIDRTGILLDLAKTVSEDFSINIRQINIQTHDNIFEGTISLYVKDAEGLHAIMDKIRKIKGIDTVKRNQD